MIKFLKQLLDFIYQEQCYLCKSSVENVPVCSKCDKKIKNNESNFSYKIEINDGVPFYYAGFYSNNMQKLIRGIKYHGQRRLAPYFARFVYEYWQNFEASKKEYTVIPVPLADERLKKRRYNHMELIANEFAKLTQYQVNTAFLRRVKNTLPQYGLKKLERIENMKNAFEISEKLDKNTNLIIFDDILTTGATVNEIIRTLKQNGFKNITVLTITSSITY